MNKVKAALNTTVGTESTLKKIMIVLLAIMLVVNMSPLGAFPSYAETNQLTGGTSSSLEPDSSNGLTPVQPSQPGNVVVGDRYFMTLAEALEAASDGDTINVIGTVEDTDTVEVDKNVTILSDGNDGCIPRGLDVRATVTIGGGNNLLKTGAIWIYGGDETTIKGNSHITGSLPLYVNSAGTKLSICGGVIEQTAARTNWNCAVGAYDGNISMSGGKIIGDGSPAEIFGDPVTMWTAGLDVPQTTELLYKLREAGVRLPLDLFDPEDCAAAIAKVLLDRR